MDGQASRQSVAAVGRYEFSISDTQTLAVTARDDGGRDLAVSGVDASEGQCVLTLDRQQAAIVAGVLAGATLTSHVDDEATPSGGVTVMVVTVGSAAPVLGQSVAGMDLTGHAEAVVLGLIRDTTNLVEDPAACRCQPGDRLVIAVLCDHIQAVTQLLARQP